MKPNKAALFFAVICTGIVCVGITLFLVVLFYKLIEWAISL